ncbi:uncharacterized protein LOC120147806 [Hibiscus syriacus]|uniref:uncharacterized protein LOC120147806 n=1 Tax=Hibiscus syriacus TaxID=106335 RepID=UPI0019228A94|nr:uncharacterized protein LOC120147806 [Hibiscus syriacus]
MGDLVFLKVSSWKKVLHFGRKGKLSPRFIGPFEVLERVGLVTYRLRLLLEIKCIHDVFHVSILLEVHKDLSYNEEPIKIMTRDVNVLWNKVIPLVKVLWRNHNTEEVTWEMEESMRA